MRRILTIIGLLLLLTVVGTVGLRVIEGEDWIDCLYMAIITLTTVGFDDDIVTTPGGKIFIIVFLVCGLGVFTYSAFQLGQWVVGVEVRSLLERRRMHKQIDKLHDHYIICGYGRMGRTIGEYLRHKRKPFVVIEEDEEIFLLEGHPDVLHLIGDAADDEVLRLAGIERAKALASVLPTDADNVYVILTARMLNPTMQIISRAGEERAIQKMERAGANRIISPYSSGAVKMARFMLSPSIEDFLEIADAEGNDLELADIQIPEHSPYVGKQLRETDLSAKGVMVIGIRRASGERLMPPPGSATLQSGDCLFAFGTAEAVQQMITVAEPT